MTKRFWQKQNSGQDLSSIINIDIQNQATHQPNDKHRHQITNQKPEKETSFSLEEHRNATPANRNGRKSKSLTRKERARRAYYRRRRYQSRLRASTSGKTRRKRNPGTFAFCLQNATVRPHFRLKRKTARKPRYGRGGVGGKGDQRIVNWPWDPWTEDRSFMVGIVGRR